MAEILPVSQMIQTPNLLAGYQQGLQFGQQQRDRRNSQQAAQLYAQAMQAPADQRPALLAQIAQLTGVEGATNAQSGLGRMDTAAHDDLVQTAGQFAAIAEADPATAQQMYPALAAKAHAIGIPVPTAYDPKFLPAIQKLAGAMGGAGAVQSTYVDAQGQRVAIMRDGSVRPLGMNAPNNQIIDTGNGFYGVNKGNLQAAPVMVGGQPQIPQQRAPGEVPFSIDPSLPPEVQAAIRANPDAGSAQGVQSLSMPGQGGQLRSAPKPMTPAQQLQMQLEQARLSLAERADQRDAARLQLAQQAATQPKPADQAKAEKLAAARSDALDSVNQAITGIDTLTKSGGFSELGTFTGDLLGHIPHTQTRDAQNALETVKNQVLLTTLSKLKALSATGASGFGALSNQEGKILQNSIANLETAQSHDAIVHNLAVIKMTLERAAGLIGSAGGSAASSAPAASGWSIQKVGN
jgi:hypothetical protein